MSQEQGPPSEVSITDLEAQYLLKELEINFDIEAKARDRAEQMLQYLLTSIAAIMGAALFLLPSMDNPGPMVFLAVLLIYIFGVTSFYRTCRLRNIITQTRLTRSLIRNALYQGNIKQARLLAGTEESLTGFSERIVRNLQWIVFLCSFVGAILFVVGGIVIDQDALRVTFTPGIEWAICGILAAAGFLLTLTGLRLILGHHRQMAERLKESFLIDRGPVDP